MARQWARLHCGLRGAETMARYQLTATELALAYDRVAARADGGGRV